jgi:hypothetical protein
MGIECIAAEQVIESPCAELRPRATGSRGGLNSGAANGRADGVAELNVRGRVARDGTAQCTADGASALVDALSRCQPPPWQRSRSGAEVAEKRVESSPAQRLLRRPRDPA